MWPMPKAPAPNHRPRSPLDALGSFGYRFYAPPAVPAALGEASRWA